MLRPPRSKQYMGFQWYANFSNGASLYYPAPGVAVTLSSYEAETEYLDDVSPGLGQLNPCTHYRRKKTHLQDSLLENLWVNTSNHALGQWSPVGGRSNSSDWIWNSAYGSGWLTSGGSVNHGPSSEFGSWDSPLTGLPSLYSFNPLYGTISTVQPDNVSDLQLAALRAMLPGIRPANNISLLNSIYELKDYRNLAVSVRNLIRRIRMYPLRNTQLFYNRRFVAWWNTVRNAPLQSACRIFASQFLNAEFNLQPLLQDICSVQRALSDYRDQFRRLVRDANKRQRRHFRRELTTQFPDSDTQEFNRTTDALVDGEFTFGRNVRYLVRQYNATLEFSYSLPLGEGDSNLPWALADRLGVNLNPRIIWAAIPWSFVFDWLVGVGQYLENFRTRNIEPVVNITGFCNSTHVKRVITTRGGFGGAVVPLFELFEDAYSRYPGLPNAYSSISTSGLSPMEFSLGAALAVTR